MFGAIVVMALAPWLDTFSKSGRYRPQFKWWFAILVIDFVVLMVRCNAASKNLRNYRFDRLSLLVCVFFNYIPILGIIETPDKQPETIEEAVELAKKKKTSQSPNIDGSSVPAE